MTIFDFLPLWRLRSPFVWTKSRGKADQLPYLSDKIARDVGIEAQELAKLRHQWPSQAIPPAQHDHLVRHTKGR